MARPATHRRLNRRNSPRTIAEVVAGQPTITSSITAAGPRLTVSTEGEQAARCGGDRLALVVDDFAFGEDHGDQA